MIREIRGGASSHVCEYCEGSDTCISSFQVCVFRLNTAVAAEERIVETEYRKCSYDVMKGRRESCWLLYDGRAELDGAEVAVATLMWVQKTVFS